jgi:flagellar biosynthesis regulator FlaF
MVGDPPVGPSLTDEDSAALLSEIYDHDLPEELDALVSDYQQFENARPPFMWKWVHRLAPANVLPVVDAADVEPLAVDRTITILFVTLLDDVLEKRRDRETFTELAAIPNQHRTADPSREGVDGDYVQFTRRVWRTLVSRLQRAPQYDRYADLFRYDVKQAINAVEYSDFAIRNPALATMDDLRRYESHNMVMFAYADVDFMHATVDVDDAYATIRSAIWIGQQMARIGNWVSTWEREVAEGDLCSGPVVYALESGLVDHSTVEAAAEGDADARERLVARIREEEVESLFLDRWERHHDRLQAIDDDLAAIDLGDFIDGTAEVLRYHLASEGLK